MADLVIRLDHEEQVIRSVGETAGVVSVVQPSEGEYAFAIDPLFQPGSGFILDGTNDGWQEHATPVGVEEIVGACEGPGEMAALFQFTLQGIAGLLALCRQESENYIDRVVSAAEFAREVRDAAHAEAGRRAGEGGAGG